MCGWVNGVGVQNIQILAWRFHFECHPHKVQTQASWIDAVLSSDGEFYVGCMVCGHAAGGPALRITKGVPKLKLWQLQRHADTETHKCNVLKMAGADPENAELEGPSNAKPPKLADFQKALAHFQDGRGFNTLDGIAAKKKLMCMEHVIVEAMRSHWKDKLRTSTSITLLRDERHKRMLLAFRCVDATLSLTQGIIGQSRSYSGTSLGLVDATLQLITTFCTPSPEKGKMGEVDQALVDHIRSHIHCTTVDDASNEVTAVVDSTSPAIVETNALRANEIAFPNHRLVVRDKAHEARRVLSRPWKADEYLDSIVTAIVVGRSSITQIIQKSDDLRAWYAEATRTSKNSAVSTHFANLRAALHRYESLVTPLSRFVLDVESVLAVAMRIATERSGHAKIVANAFLSTVDEELLVTVALMADAGDEALQIIRHFDKSSVNSARAGSVVQSFLENIVDLFCNEKIWDVRGHAHCILEWLGRTHIIRHGADEVRTIGGPLRVTANLKKICIDRLGR